MMAPTSQILQVGGLDIDVTRKDIKNLHLKVYPPDGQVCISAPLKTDDEVLRLFAISKLPWIKKNRQKFQSQPRQSPREFVSGESHYVQGQRYRLNVVYESSKPRVEIRNRSYLDLYVRPGSSRAQRESVLKEWYRQQLKAAIPPLVAKWEGMMGVEVKEWRVKLMKTNWGSCTPAHQRIWLNLRLAYVSPRCLE